MQTTNLLNGFYYLAPLWFMVEVFLWPGFRAGIIFGDSLFGSLAFYSISRAKLSHFKIKTNRQTFNLNPVYFQKTSNSEVIFLSAAELIL